MRPLKVFRVVPGEPLGQTLRRRSWGVVALVVALMMAGPGLLLFQYTLSNRAATVYSPVVDSAGQLTITLRWAQSEVRLDRSQDIPGLDGTIATRRLESEVTLGRLRALVGDGPDYAPHLTVIEEATDRWWDYAETAAGPPGITPGGQQAEADRLGALADFDLAIATIDKVRDQASAARDEIRELRTTVLVASSVAALAVALVISLAIVRGTRRTACQVAGPLEELSEVARSHRDGGRGLRAEEHAGPAEVRSLAVAINELLDTSDEYEKGQEEQIRRLEELDRLKDDFVSTVSHELRTPLASIIGYAEMMEDGDAGDLTPEQEKVVGVIQRNASRLRGLIEDLLVLSRIEAGDLQTEFVPVDLAAVVTTVLESFRPVAERAGVTLRVRLDDATVSGDELQLERAVTNLVSNAVKFTPSGGRVSVTLTRTGRGATVEVADTGIGIPAADLDRLGTRFFRASSAQRAAIPGSGLGLSIVHAIADAHHGSLTFDSVEDEGTTFQFTVPLETPAATGPSGSGPSSP